MSNETSHPLADANPENGGEDQGLVKPFKALKLSNPPALGSPPCISPPNNAVDLGEQGHDSGYASITSTPDHNKHTPTLLRKPGQTSFIGQAGLYVSNVSMDTGTKRRFIKIQLEIEKMLLEFMRKLKSVPGRQKPIAIRRMMLGKTDADTDAKPYMVVICSENIERKVQDFFDDPLVRTLCEPGEDNIPSFKTLVIGHALRLRASTSGITIRSDAVTRFHDGTKTFCGMPIRLCDEFGHLRNATFGGIVKVTSSGGEYQLYGLTAGHMIRDHQVIAVEDDARLGTSTFRDLADLVLGEEPIEASEDQPTTTSQTMTDDIDWDDYENWRLFSSDDTIGNVLHASEGQTLVNEEQSQMKPYLDWALFELNSYKPNQLPFHSREHSRGDLCLSLSLPDRGKDEIDVSMLCASQGVKHGMLSTTPARVLLDPGDSFADAYTLSLDGSEVSDGDSGSWVVDELRLEVHGHVVADDIFGDAYVIPMGDILADIQSCFGAQSVDLPSELDIISKATLRQPDLFSGPDPRDDSEVKAIAEVLDGLPLSPIAEEGSLTRLAQERHVALDSGYSSLKWTPMESPHTDEDEDEDESESECSSPDEDEYAPCNLAR